MLMVSALIALSALPRELAPPKPGTFLVMIEVSAFGPSPTRHGCIVTQSGAVMSYGDAAPTLLGSPPLIGDPLYDDIGIATRLGPNFKLEPSLSRADQQALKASSDLVEAAEKGQNQFHRITYDGGQVAITLSARIAGKVRHTYLKGWGDQEVQNSSPEAAKILEVLDGLSSSNCRPSRGF